MNKKICFFSLLLLVIMFLAGCANIEGNGTYIDNKVGEKCELHIMLGSGVRSILPEQFVGTELFYTLEGKSSRGNILAVTTLDFDPITNQASIPLEYDTWELTLIAYKDEAKTLPVLKGFRVVDLTNGECNFFASQKSGWFTKITVNGFETDVVSNCFDTDTNQVSFVIE